MKLYLVVGGNLLSGYVSVVLVVEFMCILCVVVIFFDVVSMCV